MRPRAPAPDGQVPHRGGGSPRAALSARRSARCRARLRASRGRRGMPRAPRPVVPNGRAPSSAARAAARGEDGPTRAARAPRPRPRDVPSASSASTRRSSARTRSSSRRAITALSAGSSARSASAGPRQSRSASVRDAAAAAGSSRSSAMDPAWARRSNRWRSRASRRDVEHVAAPRVSIASLPSALRSPETYPWTRFAADAGGSSPQRPSTSRDAGTTVLGWQRRSASIARCFGPPRRASRPSTTASSGPRRR